MEGQPYVIPTMFARVGEAIYFHGSAASRMLRGVSGGLAVCVTVTLIDGLVLARSVFNHSMNYRSVVALGKATLVDETEEKIAALQAFTEKILPGRWNDARQPSEKELKATSISASAAQRSFRQDAHWGCAGRRRGLRFAGVGWGAADSPCCQ